MYSNGIGVVRDDFQAVNWYMKAAQQGDSASQSNLGLMYENGRGVQQDFVIAYALFNIAFDSSPENKGIIASKMTLKQIEAGERLTAEIIKLNDLKKAITSHLQSEGMALM